MIDIGSGPPLVVLPGIQGRWEWMQPALDALAVHCRVVSFSLCGEHGTGVRLTTRQGFDAHVEHVDRVLHVLGVDAAAICGVSFGGWVALRFAARRAERVRALVLASAIGPRWRPDEQQVRYMRSPNLSLPAFVLAARARLRPELCEALPDRVERWRFVRRHLTRIVMHPASPRLMARRVALGMQEDFVQDCQRIEVPTLVVTGEPHLDRVVPVTSTREYLDEIRGAQGATLGSTGHVGLLTRPDPWAAIVGGFVRKVAGLEPIGDGRGR
ncbi:MAG: alpha/beta hydrolase [Acidobacteria bacterium]|nr:alpha/beta hydrolase [Acidobacteriota bacterium]